MLPAIDVSRKLFNGVKVYGKDPASIVGRQRDARGQRDDLGEHACVKPENPLDRRSRVQPIARVAAFEAGDAHQQRAKRR